MSRNAHVPPGLARAVDVAERQGYSVSRLVGEDPYRLRERLAARTITRVHLERIYAVLADLPLIR